MRLLPPIAANLLLFAAAIGFGSVLHRLIPPAFSRVDRFALKLLGGLAVLGTLLFCVGQVTFSRVAIILALLPGVLLGLKVFAQTARSFAPNFAEVRSPILPAIVVGAVILVTAIGGLAEPIGDMNNDSIAYHFLGPKVWVREGLIRPVPDEVLTAFPAIVESQYAALLALGGPRAPMLFAVIGILSLLLVAAGLALRLGAGPSGAWWTAALIAAMPAVYRGAYGGFIDVLFAAFVLAAARVAFDAQQAGDYVLFGMFAGAAAGAKYTGLLAWAVLLLCGFLSSLWFRSGDYRTLLKHLGLSCASALAIASPFYLRDWIFFGSPIYPPPPVLLRFFTVRELLPAVLHELSENVRVQGAGMGPGVWKLFLLPFNLTVHTANFRGAGGIGLAPLALGPIGLIAWCRDRFAKSLALFALVLTLTWFATSQVSRYLIHVYVIAAIFAVLGWQYVRVVTKYGLVFARLVVVCSILYGLTMIIPDRLDDMHSAVSPSFEARRKWQEIPYIESFHFLNIDPSVTKVLILDPYLPAFYLDKTYLKPLGRWGEQTLPDATDVQKVLAQIPGLHISHVLDVIEGGGFRLPAGAPGLRLVFQGEDQRVYRVDGVEVN